MGQLRAYAYMKGGQQELNWLWKRYAEKEHTESLEKEFVNDVACHIEELATNLSPADFISLFEFWISLAKQYWDTDQRNAFLRKLKKLKTDYHELGILEQAIQLGRRIPEEKWSPAIGLMIGGGFLSWIMLSIGLNAQGGIGIGGIVMGGFLGFVALAAIFNKKTTYLCPFCGHASEFIDDTCRKCNTKLQG